MKKNIFKNIVSLYGFTIAKMVFPLVTLPYLTRVLSVDTYGVVSYVKSIMAYFQILIDFGFLLSGTKDIVLVKSDKHKISEVSSQIFFARVLVAAGALVFLIPMTYLMPLLKVNPLFVFLSFVPTFLTAFLFDYVFRGLEKMNVITLRFVLMKTISTVLTFVFVHEDADIVWIPILDILGSIVAIVWILAEMKKMEIRIVRSPIKAILKKLSESAIYFASDIATTAFGVLLTVFIGAFCTAADVAYWSLCCTLVSAVQSMYAPILNGIYPEMVATKNTKIIKKTIAIFMPIVILGCIFTFVVSDYVVTIVGGADYLPASTLLRAFIPVLGLSFPAMLFGWPTLGAIGSATEVTATTIVAAVVQVLGLFVLLAIERFEIIEIALLRGLSELFMLVGRLALTIRRLQKNKKEKQTL